MDTREKLIEAARRCLLDRGHGDCSVKTIADLAQVNQGLVHHHFGSKEGLLIAVSDREQAEHREKMIAAANSEGLGTLFLDTLLNDHEFFDLVIEFFSLARIMPGMGEKVRECMHENREVIGAMLGIDDETSRYRAVATLLGLALWHSVDPAIPVREVAEQIFREWAANGKSA